MHSITHDHHHDDGKEVFGFWIYILSDCVLFSCLFATYAVLYKNTFGGVSIKELVSLPYIFIETVILLASSFTYGMSILALYQRNKTSIMFWLFITLILGSVFVGMELNEFVGLVQEGHSWRNSAALSSFFTLVGTHGLHVFVGLVWMLVMLVQITRFGVNNSFIERRLTYLGLFWAFLDIVWIFVFTIVYLMGAI